MEDRIDRLETTVAFQQETIAELSAFVSSQQVQLQKLEERIDELVGQVQRLLPDDAPPPAGQEPPPPHY